MGRALGWARHLPGLGWDVSILAATPTPNWPLDHALSRQIPDGVHVERVASADPRPEGLRGMGRRELSFLWYRPARASLRAMVRAHRPDVLLATSPPPTSLRLAARVGKEFGIPWVADFRDPWTVREPGPWQRRRRRVYASQARACVAVNPTLAAQLKQSLDRPVSTIYNGFEPDEMFPDVQRVSRRAVFLGSLPKLETLAAFFKALAQGNGEFLHVGHPNADLVPFARAQGLTRVESTGYLSRPESLRVAATGSVFITALAPELDLTLPTKVFDYIGLGGPLLHLGGHRAVSEFISAHALGEAVLQHQPDAMVYALERLWAKPTRFSAELKSNFTRRHQAECTAAILQDVVKGGRS